MPRTDVLIAGSGSAGIFAATWLAIYNIPFTILERRSGPLDIGQADGVQCRTVEIYESFGLSEELLREAYHILEVCFWGSDEGGDGKEKQGIKRKSRSIDTERGLSHLPHVNGLMLGKMDAILKENKGHGKVEYGWTIKNVTVDSAKKNDPAAYPCRVTAERDGKEEIWEAKYVLVSISTNSKMTRASF
jgi:phenol 2-monooxygenase